MKTHVSMNATLFKIDYSVTDFAGSLFIGYGRLVNPLQNYDGAKVVALYRFLCGKYGVKQ